MRPGLLLALLCYVAYGCVGANVTTPRAAALPAAGTNPPAIWAGAKGGPHAVGVARTTAAALEVTYWYPATSGGRAARLRDLSERSPALVEFLVNAGLPETAVLAYVDSTVQARWDAPPEKTAFPLVLIGQGNRHDALDQAVLAELVASHGFVVATIPSPTITAPMQSADDVGPFAQRQAEDLLTAATRLAALGIADLSRLTVIGHSFGARAALLLAMHDARVKAVVSLDGGIGTATAQESFTKASWFSRDHGTVPILHFYQTGDSSIVPDFALLRSLPTRDLVLRELKGLHHAHFTTMGFQSAVDESMRRLSGMEADGPASLMSMTDELLHFLSVHAH